MVQKRENNLGKTLIELKINIEDDRLVEFYDLQCKYNQKVGIVRNKKTANPRNWRNAKLLRQRSIDGARND
ncbi:hypothetical protein ACTXT7_014049 [Hymenolepis weldensis]